MAHASSNLSKYQSGNPVVQRLLGRYFATLAGIVEPLAPSSILDVGCGEGMTAHKLLQRLPGVQYTGIDLDGAAAAYAQEHVPAGRFRQGSVLELDEQADVVLCLEVLEHLDDPEPAVAKLKAAAREAVVVSVPWEPWFRLGNLARGKYLRRLGNHPEHIQQLGPDSLRTLMERHFTGVEVRTSMPWVFAWARTG